MTSTKTTVQFTPAILRAFADALETGYVGSLNEFANSDAGKAAATAAEDQRNAALRSSRMGWARAVAKDIKVNGQISTYSKDRAIQLRDFLATVDFDEVPESLPMPKRGAKDDDEVAEADEVTPESPTE